MAKRPCLLVQGHLTSEAIFQGLRICEGAAQQGGIGRDGRGVTSGDEFENQLVVGNS